jgi:glycosyltransferase involved in cell wall biosynthesis
MRGGQWQALFLTEKLGGILLTPAGSPLMRAAEARGIDARALTLPRLMSLSRQAGVLHAHDAHAHSLAVLLTRRPVVVSRRVAFPLQTTWLSRWKYRRAAHFLAVSEYVRGVLRGAGIEDERITTVYDGVPVPPWETDRRPGWYVAPAIADPRKASALAREAAARAGIDLHFSRNLTEDLRHASGLIYLTEMEGLGSAALLAMGAAVPVIASRVGGLPEVVRHGETGFTVSNDLPAVIEAIRTLEQDRPRAMEMGARGRALVRECFGLERMAAGTMAVYRRVLG